MMMMRLLVRCCSRSVPYTVHRPHLHFEIVRPCSPQGRNYGSQATLDSAKEEVREEIKVPTKILESEDALSVAFFKNVIGCSREKCEKAVTNHPELKFMKKENVRMSIKVLKALKFTSNDIVNHTTLLQLGASTLWNRYYVLRECGFQNITIGVLARYITAVSKSVSRLKTLGHIPSHVNVLESLVSQFSTVKLKFNKADIKELYNEDVPLKLLRQRVLNEYLRKRLNASEADLDKVWNVYGRVRHKNLRCVEDNIQVLIEKVGFTPERIMRNAYLLHANPEEILKIIKEIPYINKRDIREIVQIRPKLLMCSSKSLRTSLKYIKSYGIGQDAIGRCVEVLTLSPETIRQRLEALHSIAEFKVLSSNPRFLRLVHHQNKAMRRLEYLNQMKIRCTSLHILSCGSQCFAKYARDGADRSRGRDVVTYLAGVLNTDAKHIRQVLMRHPNWCHVAAIQVQQCFQYLIGRGFSHDDILGNLHILIYPISSIEEQLNLLGKKLEVMCDENLINSLSKTKILTLVLYYIESEFHFTGNGTWTEEQSQPIDHVNNSSFPHSSHGRIYNYGLKDLSNANHDDSSDESNSKSMKTAEI